MNVIYVHIGEIPKYLLLSIYRASKNNDVTVITDDVKYKSSEFKKVALTDYCEGLDQFKNVYKHFSTNKADFEFICIFRWMILKNYVSSNIDTSFYYSDSDSYIYYDLQQVYDSYYSDYDACYVMTENQDNYRWSCSGASSFWTVDCLKKFCSFIFKTYSDTKVLEEKWDYHVKNNKPGGICDMTLLYLFHKQINFYPLTKVIDGYAFDQNPFDPNNWYESEYDFDRIKKVTWKGGYPYCYNTVLKQDIKFIAIPEYAKHDIFGRGLICNITAPAWQ